MKDSCWWIAVAIFVLTWSGSVSEKIKSSVFLSPNFVLGPGSVENRFYYGIDFPKGHIAIKGFDAEVIDEAGNPIPLHETYLHHWLVSRYYVRKGAKLLKQNGGDMIHQASDVIFVDNDGICENRVLPQYFGLGSETRKTKTEVPDHYGIEIGNPAEIPPGYEEGWMLNVHAIDTRGVEDKLGCTECRCDLYNVTKDEYDRPITADYKGGLRCCYDQTQCKVKYGFDGVKKSLYLKYTVHWVDWDSSIVPVKIYIFDVTDIWKKLNSTGQGAKHICKVCNFPFTWLFLCLSCEF